MFIPKMCSTIFDKMLFYCHDARCLIVLLDQVVPGSPADRSGFRPGDVVVEFDGIPVQSITQVGKFIERRL